MAYAVNLLDTRFRNVREIVFKYDILLKYPHIQKHARRRGNLGGNLFWEEKKGEERGNFWKVAYEIRRNFHKK